MTQRHPSTQRPRGLLFGRRLSLETLMLLLATLALVVLVTVSLLHAATP